MDATPSPLLRSLSLELTLVVGALLAAGYFTLRLIQAVERLAAATERLAHESDELTDSVNRWPWQWL